MNKRVAVYIDGYNLYFGLKTKKYEKYKWLDLQKLAQCFLLENQDLICLKYFTSYITYNNPSRKRQIVYIEALQEIGTMQLFLGEYKKQDIICAVCKEKFHKYNEKMTDVNIATQMILDAATDKFDTAILVSGDTDLIPPVKAIINNFGKKVIVAFPPGRENKNLKKNANGSFIIGEDRLRNSQLPATIKKKDGYILTKTIEWQ
jgi:uncharacterized LabA/DUF88 family protein